MFNSRYFSSSSALCAGVLTVLCTVAQAQDTSGNQLTAEGLSLGAPAPEEPETREIGALYFDGEYNDWSLQCVTVAEGEDPCLMYQLLTDNNGSPIIEFTMFRLPPDAEAAAGATIVAPLETSLAQGLNIKVDDLPARNYPFAFCTTVGCYARIGLTTEEVDRYKAGVSAELTIVPIAAPNQRVQASLSLTGFTAAFEASSIIPQ
ncbi:MAG: invasion associated locus B family protein [Pseudomonadota bacterium]